MIPLFKEAYRVKSPVLFVVFNRPYTTARVFEEIKKAQPARLYIASDAPRSHVPEDNVLCSQVKKIVSQIDWPCEVKTLYRRENAGCKEAVSSAVNWFFENEEEGIILEDDCLPANSFFWFCDELLEKYRYDARVRHITGNNQQRGVLRGNKTYYFSNLTHVWGWASWKRAWRDYDKDLMDYSVDEAEQLLGNIFDDPMIISSYTKVFREVKEKKVDTWDYQLDFTNFFNHGLTIIPNYNLISNIGFGPDATHTTDADNIYANYPVTEITEITHPRYILPEKAADYYTLDPKFKLSQRKRKQKLVRKRVERFFLSLVGKTQEY